MVTTAEPRAAETAYRAYVGHTVTCDICRGGMSCEQMRRLRREWLSLCRRCAVCGTASLPDLGVQGAKVPLCDNCKPSLGSR